MTFHQDHQVGLYVPREALHQTAEVPALSCQVHMTEGEPTDETACAICQETTVRHHTPCNHWVHPACLDPWLRQSDKCPVCRAPLPMVCTATFLHNRSGPAAPQPEVFIPGYLRRSSVVLRAGGEQAATIHAPWMGDDEGEDELPPLFQEMFADEEDEEEGDSAGEEPWVDSQNHLVINASDNAQVTIRIGSSRE